MEHICTPRGRQPRRRAVAQAAVALALVLSAGACARGDEAAAKPPVTLAPVGSAADPLPPPPEAGQACDRVSLTDASALFGQPAVVDEFESTTNECFWVGDDSGLHQLHLQLYIGAEFYAPSAWGTTEPVEGIGDEAFLVRDSSVGTTAGFRRGEEVLLLNHQVLAGDASSADTADDLVALLRRAAG